jgi:hypothetical protein
MDAAPRRRRRWIGYLVLWIVCVLCVVGAVLSLVYPRWGTYLDNYSGPFGRHVYGPVGGDYFVLIVFPVVVVGVFIARHWFDVGLGVVARLQRHRR